MQTRVRAGTKENKGVHGVGLAIKEYTVDGMENEGEARRWNASVHDQMKVRLELLNLSVICGRISRMHPHKTMELLTFKSNSGFSKKSSWVRMP